MTLHNLTFKELRELRQRRRCCISCGKPLPRYPETQDGRAHQCIDCLWRWAKGLAA